MSPSNEKRPQTIDQIEVGRRIGGQIRFALQVPDLNAAMKGLLAHGRISSTLRSTLHGEIRPYDSKTLMACKSRSIRYPAV